MSNLSCQMIVVHVYMANFPTLSLYVLFGGKNQRVCVNVQKGLARNHHKCVSRHREMLGTMI